MALIETAGMCSLDTHLSQQPAGIFLQQARGEPALVLRVFNQLFFEHHLIHSAGRVSEIGGPEIGFLR